MQELYHHCRHFRFRWCSPTTSRRFLRFFKTPKKSDPPLSAQTIAAHKHTRSRWSPTSIHFSEWIRKVSLEDTSCRPWASPCIEVLYDKFARPHYTSQFSFHAVHQKLLSSFYYVVLRSRIHIHMIETTKISFLWLHPQW